MEARSCGLGVITLLSHNYLTTIISHDESLLANAAPEQSPKALKQDVSKMNQ